MRINLSIRQSLVAIAILGAVTCVVSLLVLPRLINLTNSQRVERARDVVLQQLEVIRSTDDIATNDSAPAIAIPTMLGMRGGVLAPGTKSGALAPPLDPAVSALLDDALWRTASTGTPVILQTTNGETTIIVGAHKTMRGAIAWSVHPVVAAQWVAAWKLLGFTLGLAGLALVVASIHLAVNVQRGAAALGSSLSSLGRDLKAPVVRPKLRELAGVADGIASLAAELTASQEAQSRLGQELGEQQRLAALGRVVAGVAHEVRNPLASIKLRLDLARMESDTPAALVRELEDASMEIARLDRLVADLLTVSGRRTGPRTSTDLAKLAAQRVGVVEPWAKTHGVRIEVRGSASATVDSDAVSRVLDNLIRNAVEASRPDDAVDITVSNGGSDAHIVVADRGTGVDPAREGELFEPFFTTKPEGTGLGLALSRAIASAHGGTLAYERRDGATRFELTLPATPGEKEAAE